MSLPSSNSTTWFSRTSPWVSDIANTSPTARTRCPAGASARLSLPSHCGCCAGSAISSKIVSAGAATSRLALTTLVSSDMASIQPESKRAIDTP